ncbi:MAG: hypothetical protein R3B84_21745 [Zavarzinella sp.]
MNIGMLALLATVGQAPFTPPPALPGAQYLYVHATGPQGSTVTWQPGTPIATKVNGAVGLRPGYPFRMKLSDLPDRPGVELFPTFEVRGTLVPRPGMDVSKHAVPVIFSDRDIEDATAGRLVTRYFYLENPEFAAANATGEPVEFTAPTETEALKQARQLGRMMLIVRLGDRTFDSEELMRFNIPETVWFPGVKEPGFPPIPPMLPFGNFQLYDPIIGAKGASEECLHDGGDVLQSMGIGHRGEMLGVDPSDTAMKFTSRGMTRIAPSNRVCICVPRFANVRVLRGIDAMHLAQMTYLSAGLRSPVIVVKDDAPLVAVKIDPLAGFRNSIRATGVQQTNAPLELQQLWGPPAGVSTVKGVAALAQVRSPEEITSLPGCGLWLQKSVNPVNPQKIGEIVTFTLKFTNPSADEMTDVVIVDNLTTRLEFIEGSAKSSRPATFTATPNKANSVLLRWAIDGRLGPGETGTITFQARIR